MKSNNLHLTSRRRCSSSRNTAKFRAVPAIRGEIARLYLENGK